MVLNTTDFARRSCTSTLVPEWPFGGLAFCICSSSGSVAATTQPMHHVAAPLSYGHTPTDLRAPPACTHIAGGTAAAARLPQGAADAVGVAGLQPELHVHAARAPAHGSRASGGAHAGRRRRAPAVCRPGCATQAAGAARAAAPATIRPGTRYAVHQSGAPVRGLAPRDLSTSARPPACGQCAWAGTQAPLIQRHQRTGPWQMREPHHPCDPAARSLQQQTHSDTPLVQRAGVEEPRAARLIENAGHLNIRQAAEELRKVTRSSGSRPGCAGSRACARHRAAPTLAGVPRRRPGVAWASCRAPTRTWLHHTVRGATGGAADRGVGPGRSLCRAVLGPRNAWPH